MADAVNAGQRNLYPRHDGSRYSLGYRNGLGQDYTEAMRRLSWSVSSDIPAIGQKSADLHLPEVKQVYHWNEGEGLLHPTHYTKYRHTDHLSFSKSQGKLDIGRLADPKNDVFNRLYLGSKTLSRPVTRQAKDKREMAGDVAYSNGEARTAVDLYTATINAARPGQLNIFAYQKRCAARAEIGRYREALEDANFILENSIGAERGPAMHRVKAIKDYLRRQDNFEAGYHNSTTTLVCLLRPQEHRQIVPSNPCTYGRPKSASAFGKGMLRASSFGALLGWDADGDGEIDENEFRQGASNLGFHVHAREKAVFGGGSEQRGFI